MAIGADLGNVYEPRGVIGKLPGAKTEAVPGPDGYSGCGLEKNKESAAPVLRSRYMFRLEEDEIGELRSTKPLTDQDKLDIAVNLLKRVVL